MRIITPKRKATQMLSEEDKKELVMLRDHLEKYESHVAEVLRSDSGQKLISNMGHIVDATLRICAIQHCIIEILEKYSTNEMKPDDKKEGGLGWDSLK